MDTSDQWIRDRTGIERRHYAAEGQTTVDMAEVAARRAIEAAGLTAADIDMIIVGTTTPDLVFPNPGAMLQKRLGIGGGPAFSVEAACSSFIYALSVADKFIRLGDVRRALVISSETLTPHRLHRPTTAVLFADGAGAVVLEPRSSPASCPRTRADGVTSTSCTAPVASAGYEPGRATAP
jgi:3-oxoacyl-[acyl-carrier-protein] synthase-3